ncbi:MAG: protein-disulfide reductase DsbD family protein, partial [Planctomycetaceae bacterium]
AGGAGQGPIQAGGVAVAGGPRASRGVDPSGGLMLFLLTAAAAGFAALLTPCVFPMVPITVSFFQKQAEQEHHRPVTMALVYCLGIVGTFTLLGVVMSSVFGAASLNTLANNPWLNLFIAGVMVFFGLNLLGLFEIAIPSFLLNYTSGQESRGGLVGVLFMALTFTLTSFTCTFAFVGWLLAMAANGARLWPVLGLLVFSAAFSLPFFFLALFPSWLKRLPKAGGWMNRFKVVMGLLEIGAAFKFLSVADLAWNPVPTLFDNELVLSAWLVLLVAMGIYLLGWVRLPHDIPTEHTGVAQFFVALSCLGLAAYMAVGLYGSSKPSGRLWELIAAFAPPKFEVAEARQAGVPVDSAAPAQKSVVEMGPTLQEGGLRYALDYRKAMEYATKTGRPVFLEFTGVNCVNCRKMEQGPLSSPAVREKLKEFVCIQIWMDQVPTVQDATERRRLLEQNRELQVSWFDDLTMPAYVVVGADPDLVQRGKGTGILAEKLGYDADAGAFAQFLEAGLVAWRKANSQAVSSLK